eukprot:CAMPEP_0206001816 /NCGR_PEP_ID=MMETSP1464-20131121/2350_1 /ASSEMBLY_ACC=CAM_ASM_001124 /TAXON_ID=119497 /ORGANISM="Exanthemachrysis gayraliae, Strain RCC1523" /LENGTH=302 /DNA_ID=CAMNT_0053375139 /DNA_START=202 /DNA_END=1111 /DNA_ORIENTATION=+
MAGRFREIAEPFAQCASCAGPLVARAPGEKTGKVPGAAPGHDPVPSAGALSPRGGRARHSIAPGGASGGPDRTHRLLKVPAAGGRRRLPVLCAARPRARGHGGTPATLAAPRRARPAARRPPAASQGRSRELPAVANLHGRGRGAGLGPLGLHGLDHVHALDHLAEHDVLAVQPARLGRADEELAPVGVGPGVCHGQDARARVRELEVLVGELAAVDGLAARAVALGEVPALAHEARDDAVEPAALEVDGLPDWPTPFSPVQSARKFSAVRGTSEAKSSITRRPAGEPPMLMSKKTFGLDMA